MWQCVGAWSRQNESLRGRESKNLPKMADFCHIFLLMGVGDKSFQLIGPHAPYAPLLLPLAIGLFSQLLITYHSRGCIAMCYNTSCSFLNASLKRLLLCRHSRSDMKMQNSDSLGNGALWEIKKKVHIYLQ